MHQPIFKVATASGKILIENATRYEADKALFTAKEPARLWREGYENSVANNHDIFPLEPVSTWIPVTSRLPEMTDFEVSEQVLFTDGVERYVGKYYSDADDWTPEDEQRPRWIISGRDGYEVEGVTHWQPLPALP